MIEVAGFFLSSKLMDHPKIGRKKGVYYGLVIIFCVSVMIILVGEDNILFLFTAFGIIKFIVSATFMVPFLLCRYFFPTLQKYTKQWFEARPWAFAQFLVGLGRHCWGSRECTLWSGSGATDCMLSLLGWVEFRAMGRTPCLFVPEIVRYHDF